MGNERDSSCKSPIMAQHHTTNGQSVFIDCSSSSSVPSKRKIEKGSKNGSWLMSALRTFLPVLCWLPNYKGGHLAQDLIAGVTVGLMVIPQGIAYGFLAGLPPQVTRLTVHCNHNW